MPVVAAEFQRGGKCGYDGGHVEVHPPVAGVAPSAEHPPRQREGMPGAGEVVGEIIGRDTAVADVFALGVHGDGVAVAGGVTGRGIDGEPAVRNGQRVGHRGQPRH
ncbi:hypothetical protein DL990_08870 [Amycolatopsis sp. WAC 01416]|nr:hypothetical protein DL990_08870 [Amycolatopsis sp. WAC 01416]